MNRRNCITFKFKILLKTNKEIRDFRMGKESNSFAGMQKEEPLKPRS
jgi:hypothetical protein